MQKLNKQKDTHLLPLNTLYKCTLLIIQQILLLLFNTNKPNPNRIKISSAFLNRDTFQH